MVEKVGGIRLGFVGLNIKHWELRSLVESKKRRRAGAESLGRKTWLGDEGAGGVTERDGVTFGSVGDWKLGKRGN